jgi:predicted SAM-dependent methyltransferase
MRARMPEPTERLKRTQHPLVRDGLLRLAGAAHLVTHGHHRRARRVQRYLATAQEPRLQIGAGGVHLPGWLNSDLISGDIHVDLGRRFPFADATFAHVFGEHVIEHLGDGAGERLLRELRRVLRPGGVLRLTTPDLRKLIALYEDRNPVIGRDDYLAFLAELTGRPHDRPAQLVNTLMRGWGHRYVYDEDDLTARLRRAGFDPVVRREPGESDHPALRSVERHGGAEWVNRAEAMCLEATRPR